MKLPEFLKKRIADKQVPESSSGGDEKGIFDAQYKKLLHENEVRANQTVITILQLCAIPFAGIWFLYTVGAFPGSGAAAVQVIFPVCILLLLSTGLYRRRQVIGKPAFKYFLISLFILVMACVNIILPRHGVMAWAICVVLACHYYDPKMSRITYIATMLAMLACLYGGMIFGEWDNNIMLGDYYQLNGIDINSILTPGDRIAYLSNYITEHGENRWKTAFTFYYLDRGIILTMVYACAAALSKRTRGLIHTQSLDAAKHERMETELSLATRIQANMLPNVFPIFPEVPEFSVYATMSPAREVGGDFYDIFAVDSDHYAFVIADVSGKGVPAALFMVIAKTLIKSNAELKLPVEQVFANVNNALCNGNAGGLFVTAWMGILELSTHTLTFVNAGHNPPLLMNPKGEFEYVKKRSGFVLSAMENLTYKPYTVCFEPGSKLYLYTDGITEATSVNDELYGEERLQSYLNAHRTDEEKQLLQGLTGDIDAFVQGAEQFDDMTMLILTCNQ